METCLADGTIHATAADLHGHLRRLNLRQEDYYHKYLPRFCKQTRTSIPYRNREQYLTQDFVNAGAMKIWFKLNPVAGRDYAVELLQRRKYQKGIRYALGEVELLSLSFPTVSYYMGIGDGYGAINQKIGLKNSFDYECAVDFIEKPHNFRVMIDTREQNPLKISNALRGKLDYGDYRAESGGASNLAVERKSLPDFISTFGNENNLERFVREAERAVKDGASLVVLNENSLESALSFDSDFRIVKHTRMRPEMVFHNVREIIQEYRNVQFAFCSGRVHMRNTVEKLLLMKNDAKTVDLQYQIGKGVF